MVKDSMNPQKRPSYSKPSEKEYSNCLGEGFFFNFDFQVRVSK